MKEKKQSADWYIAATHYLTSGLAMPFLVALILGIPTALLIGKDNALLSVIANSVLWFLGIWLGVIYSSRYLKKTYIIKDKDKIARLAMVYLVVLGGGFRLNKLFSIGINLEWIIDFCAFVVVVIAFHLFSKKYLQNTEIVENQTNINSTIETQNGVR